MKGNNIAIDFKYKLFNSDEWHKKEIGVKECFDLKYLEEGEELSVDNIPLHNHLINYFNSEKEQIHQISIDILDLETDNKLHFFQTFWNKQENFITERMDTVEGRIDYHELIISTLLPSETTNNAERDYEIMRFLMKEKDIKCLYHGVIHDNPDGSQSELIINTGTTK